MGYHDTSLVPESFAENLLERQNCHYDAFLNSTSVAVQNYHEHLNNVGLVFHLCNKVLNSFIIFLHSKVGKTRCIDQSYVFVVGDFRRRDDQD